MHDHDHGWEQARQDAHRLGRALRLTPELVPLHQAGGRVLARDLVARYPIPHCATSAMDGFAVSGQGPWRLLNAVAPNPAESAGVSLAPGEAVSVVTGSLIPEGAESIIRLEHTIERDGLLTSDRTVSPGADIRPAGTEATPNDVLQAAGTVLCAGVVATAAVAGYDELLVAARPRVHLVYTGDEVTTSGTPAPGQVRDGFSPVLPQIIAALGGRAASAARIGDSQAQSLAALTDVQALAADIVITTGGTGFSDRDFVRSAAAELGGKEIISSIAMRPGHPSMLAALPDGRILVALPGNPLAALMAVATLVDPLLRGACGTEPEEPGRALGTADFAPLPGRHRLIPARWVRSGDPLVPDALAPAEHVGSAMLRGLSGAEAILVIPPAGARAGTPVGYLRLPW
ncbi:molybdopterin molybdotransferase MoeA [Paeniglutamicibacter kerguelensis]|uniref:Molybdopterin molybdenumtransferase n=1 Tax=Paeniglutamicibacter kerguelensis TaxID=254788 RepID=A0ABS4X875_9MICC|nr:molybdopterin molybdotransferase MoeA [Paeniglutamicibacter kerguelensis]MBP2384573.1 molybdopterin molybdotransferase [Paeniglutamicibacter kerguelensis]